MLTWTNSGDNFIMSSHVTDRQTLCLHCPGGVMDNVKCVHQFKSHLDLFSLPVTLGNIYMHGNFKNTLPQWSMTCMQNWIQMFSHNILFQSYFFLLRIHLLFLTLLCPNIFLMSGNTEWCTWHCVRTSIKSYHKPCVCIQWLVQSWVAVPGRKQTFHFYEKNI